MSEALATRMRVAAARWRDTLDADARRAALAPLDTPDRREWTYLPGPRPGVALLDLTQPGRDLVGELLDAALSAPGARSAREVMELDGVLRELEREAGRAGWQRRHPLHYWVRLLGDPADEVWAWHLGGHHLAVHVTVVGDAVSAAPLFLGANPAVVRRGPRQGWQVLRREERLARDLLADLSEGQREHAMVSADAPDDIATRNDPVADPSVVPAGLPRRDLTGPQQVRFDDLLGCYLGRITEELASAAWRSVRQAGVDEVTFAWSGSTELGGRHYYALRGPTFLVEYDNTQDGANHVHTVWRDLRRDWGADLLAAHHAAAHSADSGD